jgi:hypothetical protein
MEAFGYSSAWDEEVGYQKYPFILKHQGNRKQTGKFDFAGWDSETNDRTNLFENISKKARHLPTLKLQLVERKPSIKSNQY